MKATTSLRVTLLILVAVTTRFDLANCIPVSELDSLSSGTLLPSGSQGETSAASPPPLIFPTGGNGVYKIVENDTALKILQARAAAELTEESSQHTEPAEGQNVQQQETLSPVVVATVKGDGGESTVNNSSSGVSQSTTASSINYDTDNDDDGDGDGDDDDDDNDDYSSEEDDGDDDGTIDTDVVNVQPEDPNKEDGLEEQFGRNKDNHYPLVIDNTMIEVSGVRQEHVWVFVAGAIFVLTLTAYIAMVVYRNRLERRYGMRQRLVTEDDYYTNNDI